MKKTMLLKRFGYLGFAFFLIKGLIWIAVLMGFGKLFSNNKMIDTMKVSVYDTYVKKKDGTVMHFDILVPDNEKDYLATKGQAGQPLTSKECRFCHIEQADKDMEQAIASKGYFIIEMQGCE
jgi:Domain of unknown function (DUF2024)